LELPDPPVYEYLLDDDSRGWYYSVTAELALEPEIRVIRARIQRAIFETDDSCLVTMCNLLVRLLRAEDVINPGSMGAWELQKFAAGEAVVARAEAEVRAEAQARAEAFAETQAMANS